MSDKIRIAYNWIGPRGPIPNTEVPNILNIASVAQSASTNSTRFWSDSIWHLLFCNNHGYDLSSTNFLSQHDKFIYPMALTWRLNFTTYFYQTSGILEYSDTSEQTLHLIRHGSGFILIEDSAEAHIERNQLEQMHSYFSINNIPINKVIYLTGCMNAQQIYDQWCLERLYHKPEDKMNIFSFPVSQDSLAIYFTVHNPQIPEYDTERAPEKLFLSWNRRFRPHRVAIGFGLDKLKLIDRSYISMGLTDPENINMHITHSYNDYLLKYMQITTEDKNNFVNKLPLVLDGETNINQMCQDFNDATRPYYQNSLVSIVSETNFDAPEVTLTEKSFKPIKEKHPFITVGAPGTLRALKEMGFQTFNTFWDEGYDDVVDSSERMKKILDICQHISTWNTHQIIDFRRRVKPILDHNYETLKTRYSVVVATKIRERILEITNK